MQDSGADTVDRPVKPGADRTGADRTGADRTGADRTGADRTGADRTGGKGAVLHRCPFVFGELGRLGDQLRITSHQDALLVDWALYDARRQLIADSAYYRAVNGMEVLGGQPDTTIVPARATHRLPPGRYFWLGPLHLHFGHFLVSSLSRLWALERLDPGDFTFLYTGGLPPAEMLGSYGFIRDCFAALGITANRLQQVLGPLGIPNVTVAEPSFVENFGASAAYARTLRRIREALVPDAADNVRAAPVYVSKKRMTQGIRTISNEDSVTDILRAAGVEIAFPDMLPFPQQIRFWCENQVVAGFSGSAFHMAGFSGGKRLCTVFGYTAASSNQIAIDSLVGNGHLHLHAGTHMRALGATDQFADVLSITDPEDFARELLVVLSGAGDLHGQRAGVEPQSACRLALGWDPFGSNIARSGRASQSSTYSYDTSHPVAAEGAISGRLTGLYQCHTEEQEFPWWQVELPTPSRIYEVRIFNRTDGAVAPGRLARFRLSFSDGDGAGWRDVLDHEGPAPGGEEAPFRWQPPGTEIARVMRITLLGRNYLHLDQVEVFGEPV